MDAEDLGTDYVSHTLFTSRQALGVDVISVCVDSHFVHKMWNDHEIVKMVEGGVPFHMAADQAGNVGCVRGPKGTEATPAGWMPGDPVLKPGPDLVGNVWKVWKPSVEK